MRWKIKAEQKTEMSEKTARTERHKVKETKWVMEGKKEEDLEMGINETQQKTNKKKLRNHLSQCNAAMG